MMPYEVLQLLDADFTVGVEVELELPFSPHRARDLLAQLGALPRLARQRRHHLVLGQLAVAVRVEQGKGVRECKGIKLALLRLSFVAFSDQIVSSN